MSSVIPPFSGFNKDTFKFLADLSKDKNNNTAWFAKNRSRYEEKLVLPSKSFITSIGQFFNHLNPSIRTEPKFNKTMMRINKDMRFTKGVPYKTYFLIHFGRFKMDSEFFVYLDMAGIEYGLFINNSLQENLYFNRNLFSYKKEIIETCSRFKINNKFGFYELGKESVQPVSKFNAAKNISLMEKIKYIILQKKLPLVNKLVYSEDFLIEAIKTFSNLYPLYCFAISPQPLNLIEDFEERLGVAL